MRFRRLLIGLLPGLLATAVVSSACLGEPSVDVALVMKVPHALLDDATEVSLQVFKAGEDACQEDGSAGTVPGTARRFDLGGDCEDGVKWCGEISLPQDGSTQAFYVQAKAENVILAQGCATAKIDQDPLNVDIQVKRYLEPSCCNDGVVQPREQCDTGTPSPTDCSGAATGVCGGIIVDAVCDCNCSGKEIPVDRKEFDASAGPVGQGGLAMAFGPGANDLADGLRAVFQNSNNEASADIAVRFFKRDLYPIANPPSLAGPARLFFQCTGVVQPLARAQLSPSVTMLGDKTVVAFLSNVDLPQRFDVQMAVMTGLGCNEVTVAPTVSDETSSAFDVDIAAGPGNDMLIVWSQGGSVRGRRVDDSLDTANFGDEFTIASSGSGAKVAGTSSGWVVTYHGPGGGDDDGVYVKRVSSSFQVGGEKLVNAATNGTQDQPDVAAFADGRFAVVFRSNSDVFFQRFGADDAPVGGDQELAIHAIADGDQAAPTIAAGSANELYVAAWESTAAGTIHARFIGADTGFLFNNVTGQNDDFVASSALVNSAARRQRPAAAIGTSFVAIGWEDQSAEHPGVFVRRFPLPSL